MADALVSSLVNTILGNLNALVLEELGVAGGLKAELQNLESTLTTVQAVLQDAEQKQWKSEAVKNWLRKLKDAAYGADDVLDEFSIEAQRRRQQKDWNKQVRSFFFLSQNPIVFRLQMVRKLKNVREKLDAIASEKNKFHLREGVMGIEGESFDWRLTSSLVNESEICGRIKEKEVLTSLLLTNSDDLSVHAICGMGGLGKTTLAQLIYNDRSIGRHFDLKIWVCVSDDFDIRRLTKAIIESIEGSSCNVQELDPLQRRLQEKLSGRKFLLVLDDVWDHHHDKWNGLKDALGSGAKGSAVIVTTRIKTVALKMSTVPLLSIRRLSDDDSWSLFKQRAFGMERREEYECLETIGKAIVKKCGGIPLAVKALGSLMRLKRNESEWLAVKESEIWHLPDEGSTILPALRLSYDHLPPHLRQCFAFCSIFPKDYVMEKDQLIELWMANGFISSKGHMDLHSMGHEIFSQLVWRSLLQDVKENIWGKPTCKMHDLFHDLAQSIMIDECISIEPNIELVVSSKVRHLAVCKRLFQVEPWNKDLLKAQSLRSLVFLDVYSWSDRLLPSFFEQKHLRALDVSGFNVGKLPESVGNLKHLRYLNVSVSSIKTLPDSITSLQNLQTLNLRDCYYLYMLPKDMKNMKNLSYLDIEGCDALRSMPVGMGQLTCLRKLSMFIVGKDDGNPIRELRGLNHLEGELSIMNLDNVRNLGDAKSANLMSKKNLQSLRLYWRLDNPSEISEDVLSGLQPHSNLKKLQISQYHGSSFPSWIMDLLLPNLVEIWLGWCYQCEHLPPLGKLKFLKSLHISGMDAVKYIDNDMYGDGVVAFPSLERLSLDSMYSLEEWKTVGGRDFFPCLHALAVRHCPRLVELPVISSVKKLEIESSAMLLRSVMNLTSLTYLRIVCFPEVTLLPEGLMQNLAHLVSLDIEDMRSLKSLSDQLNNLSALKYLSLQTCDKLDSLPDCLWNLHSLEKLYIYGCMELYSLPNNGLNGLSSLRKLTIMNCEKFASLSEGLQCFTALENLFIGCCPELNSLPDSVQHLTTLRQLAISDCKGLFSLTNQMGHLTMLSQLQIFNCPNLMSLPEGIRSLKMLRELRIRDCPHLETVCEKEKGEDWPKIAHIPNIHINDKLIQFLNC